MKPEDFQGRVRAQTITQSFDPLVSNLVKGKTQDREGCVARKAQFAQAAGSLIIDFIVLQK
eukprot:CAMPEP_0116868018 /NCGR_PEP_ID=MMETSP0418-20121206/26951_1 /TAXON_ID=1158023 /ORGANISM="Astrosyne radiata, Strain 13vi08-1A" /LENGTH=60 /DNA_ID=CAMNT_0004503917 /DNA_START=725 /DNA_END=907 /DNA_ORIENTATION=+